MQISSDPAGKDDGIQAIGAPSIARPPSDIPASLGHRGPANVRVDLETVEVTGQLAEGTSYTYWTFNGKVPGPFIRVKVGDQVEVHLKNSADSTMTHSVEFHAASGPDGGAAVSAADSGQETSITFKPLNPGLYVYHCATQMVSHHIANGMYGLMLVEPEEGLRPVEREFYVMQGEIYTVENMDERGELTFSPEKLHDERPEYYVFNGAVGALINQYPLQANVGETVRIFFGVGGPNHISSFHVTGEIFDRVYNQASITTHSLTDVQTTLVPVGGAVMVEFRVDKPGRYLLVDHAFSRVERGLAGYLLVEDPLNQGVVSEADDGNARGDLVNIQWELMSFGEDGAETPVIEGSTITLEFGEHNQAGGSGGCNSYGAEYDLRYDSLSFNDLFSTQMDSNLAACEDKQVTEQESRYFEALKSVSRFTIIKDQLTLWYAEGKGRLNFIKRSS